MGLGLHPKILIMDDDKRVIGGIRAIYFLFNKRSLFLIGNNKSCTVLYTQVSCLKDENKWFALNIYSTKKKTDGIFHSLLRSLSQSNIFGKVVDKNLLLLFWEGAYLHINRYTLNSFRLC